MTGTTLYSAAFLRSLMLPKALAELPDPGRGSVVPLAFAPRARQPPGPVAVAVAVAVARQRRDPAEADNICA